MKKPAFLAAGVLLLFLAACDRTSSMQGKIVDGKGKPFAGVTVVASQVQPIKGYERFEDVTGRDGSFSFRGLYPMSGYILRPQTKKWTTSTSLALKSAPRQETALLPGGPLMVRFTVSANGVISDTATDLEWFPGPDEDTNWNDAWTWINHLNKTAEGWRLPTVAELKKLFDDKLEDQVLGIDPLFRLTADGVWSSESGDPEHDPSARYVSFYYGDVISSPDSNPTDLRAFAVRSWK